MLIKSNFFNTFMNMKTNECILIANKFNNYAKIKYGLDFPRTKIEKITDNEIYLKIVNYASDLSTVSDGWEMRAVISFKENVKGNAVLQYKGHDTVFNFAKFELV